MTNDSILIWLIVILMSAGVIAWLTGKKFPLFCRWISLVAVTADLLLVLPVLFGKVQGIHESWLLEFNAHWITRFGINLHFALDGLSLLLLILTFFLGILSILISWKEIEKNTGFFHFNILWILSGITGVFLSLDLFLFYFFWEVMLIPMYFLIGIWGHENRIYASYKFFIFTQASGLLMFLAILALYLFHGQNTGNYTFDYEELKNTSFSSPMEMIIMLGFLVAFAVKLPVVPVHNWLPDAHTEAPTAGSLILAGLMLKTGAYGLLRFVIPFFPDASLAFAPFGMLLGVAGILYGAKLAFAQTDLKRLVAYTSVSHMGFVILGIFAFNEMAGQGVVMQMLAHGISTGALFVIVGQIQERIHTRDLQKMGGMWDVAPVMAGTGLVFSMASLGLPGMGNFIAEFLTLNGTFQSNVLMTCLASLGLVAATVYALRIMQKVFYGKKNPELKLADLNLREKFVMAALIIAIFYLGLFPQGVIRTAKPALMKSLESSERISSKTGTSPVKQCGQAENVDFTKPIKSR